MLLPEPSQSFDRRGFLKASGLIAIAAHITGVTGCKTDPDDDDSDCVTTEDILGPYYKPNAPETDDIIPTGAAGNPIVIQGKVLTDCSIAIADATVEIWNADVEGVYDSSEEFRFRGRYKTLTDGVYHFRTIVPGKYLNGNTYRPSHIHFRISAPGHRELVSQIYFKDDPYISNDPWASSDSARERILTIVQDSSGLDVVNFDIKLLKLT